MVKCFHFNIKIIIFIFKIVLTLYVILSNFLFSFKKVFGSFFFSLLNNKNMIYPNKLKPFIKVSSNIITEFFFPIPSKFISKIMIFSSK